MTLQEKINIFLNKSQAKVASIALATSYDLFESYASDENIKLATELVDVITSLQYELLDWTNKDIESVIDYYNTVASLTDLAIVNFEDQSTFISGESSPSNSWEASYIALNEKVDNNYQEFLDEIERLDNEIANLDFSNLIPQDVLDEINANSAARHTHTNKTVLDNITQSHLDSIALNNTHRANNAIHVTTTQKTTWDNKVSQVQLTDGLALKANTVHSHEMSDVNGLTEAFAGLAPEKGDKGEDGITPTLVAGTIAEGNYDIEIDNTDPAYPVLNITIPPPKDGEDFHIDVFGAATGRLSSVYDTVDEGYSYLGTDNGTLYFRKPYDSLGNFVSAVTTTGWTGVQFMGYNGWSPVLGTYIVNDTKTVLILKGWTGGSGSVPTIGSDYTLYLGHNGYTQSIDEATNIKGNQGNAGTAGKIMFPDISDTLANRYLYDDSPTDTIFLDNVPGVIYRKLSMTTGDWSSGYQWKGDKGEQGDIGGGSGTVIPSFTDDQFEILDNIDSTKKVKLEVSGITGNTTRILSIPDKNGTIALLDDVSSVLSSNVALSTPLLGATNQDAYNVANEADKASNNYEYVFVEALAPDIAKITRNYAWRIPVGGVTDTGGVSTITTSANIPYKLGTTVTAGSCLKVAGSVVGMDIQIKIEKV